MFTSLVLLLLLLLTAAIQGIYFMKIECTGSIPLANGNVRVRFGDDSWSTIFREGVSESKKQKSIM